MHRLFYWLILILGLTFIHEPAVAQRAFTNATHWYTGGAGLSTPTGFNLGASYNLALPGPLFLQLSASTTQDPYITKHSVYAIGPALGVRGYTDIALTSLSVGPTYTRGTRGADLTAPGTSFETGAATVTGQLLFRELNLGVEGYWMINPIRNVSGVRLIYRLGKLR